MLFYTDIRRSGRERLRIRFKEQNTCFEMKIKIISFFSELKNLHRPLFFI